MFDIFTFSNPVSDFGHFQVRYFRTYSTKLYLNTNPSEESDDPVEDVVNQSGFESSVRGFKQTEFFNEMNSLFNEMSHFENEFNINPDESRFPGIESGFDAGLSELDGFDPILAAPESSDADFEIFRAPDKDDAPIVATENDDSEAQLEVLDIFGKLKVMIFLVHREYREGVSQPGCAFSIPTSELEVDFSKTGLVDETLPAMSITLLILLFFS